MGDIQEENEELTSSHLKIKKYEFNLLKLLQHGLQKIGNMYIFQMNHKCYAQKVEQIGLEKDKNKNLKRKC